MLELVWGITAARSLVHGGQYAVHDRDKTWTVLTGHKKRTGGGAGGVRLENSVERISPSESKGKLSCTFMYLKKHHAFSMLVHKSVKKSRSLPPL